MNDVSTQSTDKATEGPPHIRRIIGGELFDTATAERIAEEWSLERAMGEYTPFDTSVVLYRNKYGRFFLRYYNDDLTEGLDYEPIRPLDRAQALAWCEKNLSTDDIEAFFGPIAEAGADEVELSVRVPQALLQQIKEVVEERNKQRRIIAWTNGTRLAPPATTDEWCASALAALAAVPDAQLQRAESHAQTTGLTLGEWLRAAVAIGLERAG